MAHDRIRPPGTTYAGARTLTLRLRLQVCASPAYSSITSCFVKHLLWMSHHIADVASHQADCDHAEWPQPVLSTHSRQLLFHTVGVGLDTACFTPRQFRSCTHSSCGTGRDQC